MKILLVDDDAFIRELIQNQLSETGWDITALSTAEEAARLLAASHFDLLITDIVLSGIDGGKLMQHARTHNPDLPIIAITGGVENAQDDYAHYADMFADETLVKPIAKDKLIAAIGKYVSE